jgi:small subunit ribosomal protein S4e
MVFLVALSQVKVDGRVRTDINFPAGFMDVIELEKSGDRFRLLYDTKGRFFLHAIDKAEAGYKLCKVVRQETTKKGIPVVVTHDGRTIRYPAPALRVNDTVKVDIASGKIIDSAKMAIGATVMAVNGRNQGRVGTLVTRERHPGSFDIVHVRDARGASFATRLTNIFVIGREGEGSTLVSLPAGEGIKKSIFEQRDLRIKRG